MKWAERAKDQGHIAVHDEILEAIEQMDRAIESLRKALKRLGGNPIWWRGPRVWSLFEWPRTNTLEGVRLE